MAKPSDAHLRFRREGEILNWTKDMQKLTIAELLMVSYRIENSKLFQTMFIKRPQGIICRICSTKAINGKQNLDAHITGKNHKRAVEVVAEYRHKTLKSLAEEAAAKKTGAATPAKSVQSAPTTNKPPANANSGEGKATETKTPAPATPKVATSAAAKPKTATTTPAKPVAATSTPAKPVAATTTPAKPVVATTTPAKPVAATSTTNKPSANTPGKPNTAASKPAIAGAAKTVTTQPVTNNAQPNKAGNATAAPKAGNTAGTPAAKQTPAKPALASKNASTVAKTTSAASAKPGTQPAKAAINKTTAGTSATGAKNAVVKAGNSATPVVTKKEDKSDAVIINDQPIETVDLLSDTEDPTEVQGATAPASCEKMDVDPSPDAQPKIDRETLNQIRMLKSVIATMGLSDLKQVEFRRIDTDWKPLIKQQGVKFTCNACNKPNIGSEANLKLHFKEAKHILAIDQLQAFYHPIICPTKLATKFLQEVVGNDPKKAVEGEAAVQITGPMSLEEFKSKHVFLPLFELLKIEYRDKSNIWYSLITKNPTSYRCAICRLMMGTNAVNQHLQGKKHSAAASAVTEMHHPKYCIASDRTVNFANDVEVTGANKKTPPPPGKENMVLNPVSVFRRIDHQIATSTPTSTLSAANRTAPPPPVGKSLPVVVGRGATRNTILGKRPAPTNHPGLQPPSKQAKGPSFATKTFSAAPEVDTNIEGYIGVEYVVKILLNAADPSPKFECCLCEFEADGPAMQAHLKNDQHRLKYLDRHFRTCMREFEPYRNDPTCKNLITEIAHRLSVAIEKHHGRDLPYECLQEEYRLNRPEIMAKVFSFRHASEYSGPSMVHVIDKATLSEMVKNKHKFGNPIESQKQIQSGKSQRSAEVFDEVRATNQNQQNQYLDVDEHRRLVDQFLRNTNRDSHRRRSRSLGRTRARSQSRGRSGRARRSRSRSMGRRRSRSGDMWSAYKRMFDHASRDLNTDYKRFERDPETHPLYQKEWKIFWQKRSEELAQDGRDPRNYDFQPEWILFWTRRMDQIYEEELDNLKKKLRDRLKLPYHNHELRDKRYHIGNQRQATSAFSQIRQNMDNMGGGAPGPNMMDVDQPNIGGDMVHMMASGPGGPNLMGAVGPDMMGPGGPNMMGPCGPNMGGPFGPDMMGSGGPNMGGPFVPDMMGPGGPNMMGPGGPNMMGSVGPPMMGHGGDNMAFNMDVQPNVGPFDPSQQNMFNPHPVPFDDPSQHMGSFENVPQNMGQKELGRDGHAATQHRNIRPITLEPNIGKQQYPAVSNVQRGINLEPSRRRDPSQPSGKRDWNEPSPSRREREPSPVSRRPREESPRGRRARDQSPPNRQTRDQSDNRLRDHRRNEDRVDSRKGMHRNMQPDEEPIESGPLNIVSVLRLLTALEDNLGILGPRVVDLMTKALTYEKAKPGSADRVLLTPENAVFLETVREKLRGQIVVGILDASKTRAVNNAIRDVTELLNQSVPNEPPPIRVERVEVSAPIAPAPPRLSQPPQTQNNNTEEKRDLAMKLASALAAQGKTNVSSDQLEQLIAVYSLIEKKQREATTTTTEPPRRQNLSDLLVDSLKGASSRPGGNMGGGAQINENRNASDRFDDDMFGNMSGGNQFNQNRNDSNRFDDLRDQQRQQPMNTSQDFGRRGDFGGNNNQSGSPFQSTGRSVNVNRPESDDFEQNRSSSGFMSSSFGLSNFDTSLSLATRPQLNLTRNKEAGNRQQGNFGNNLNRNLDDDDDRQQQSNFGNDFNRNQTTNTRQHQQSNFGNNMNRYQDSDNRQQGYFGNEMNRNQGANNRQQGDFGDDMNRNQGVKNQQRQPGGNFGNNMNRNQNSDNRQQQQSNFGNEMNRNQGNNRQQQQDNFGNNSNRNQDGNNRQQQQSNFGNNRNQGDNNRQNQQQQKTNFGNSLNRNQLQDNFDNNSQNSATFMTNMGRVGNAGNKEDLVAYPNVRQRGGGGGMAEGNMQQSVVGRNQGNNQQMPMGWQQNNNNNRGGNNPNNRNNNNQNTFRRRR